MRCDGWCVDDDSAVVVAVAADVAAAVADAAFHHTTVPHLNHPPLPQRIPNTMPPTYTNSSSSQSQHQKYTPQSDDASPTDNSAMQLPATAKVKHLKHLGVGCVDVKGFWVECVTRIKGNGYQEREGRVGEEETLMWW